MVVQRYPPPFQMWMSVSSWRGTMPVKMSASTHPAPSIVNATHPGMRLTPTMNAAATVGWGFRRRSLDGHVCMINDFSFAWNWPNCPVLFVYSTDLTDLFCQAWPQVFSFLCSAVEECRELTGEDAPTNGGLVCTKIEETNSRFCSIRYVVYAQKTDRKLDTFVELTFQRNFFLSILFSLQMRRRVWLTEQAE